MTKLPKKINKAWKLIEQYGWCRGEYARTKNNRPCEIENGAKFCAYGAVRRVYLNMSKADSVINKLRSSLGNQENYNITDWNDSYTRKDKVVQKLKELDI